MIKEIINNILAYEIKIVPVFVLYIICIAPTEFRKHIRFKYAPIYCSLPPFAQSRRLRDFYFNGIDENTNEDQNKIIKGARASFYIDTAIIPIMLGFIFGICKVPWDVINPLFILIILKRGYQFLTCIYEIYREKILNNKHILKLFGVYVIFLALFIYNMRNSYILGTKEFTMMLPEVVKFMKNLVWTLILGYFSADVSINDINNRDEYIEEIAIDKE